MPASTNRQEFYRRIDQALENGGKLAFAIEALAAESHSKNLAPDIQELLRTLRGKPTAEQFVMDGSKAVWLPLILRSEPASGSSDDFKRLLNDLTVVTQFRKNNWLHFMYPLVVLAVAIVMFVLLATTIIPTFQSMFVEFQLRLPRSTQMLISISVYLRNHPVMSCFWLIGLTLVFIGFRKVSSLLKRYLEATTLVGPFLSGNAESVRAMGRFTSTLAELLHLGAPLDEAILIAGRSSQNRRFIKTSEILSREIGDTHSIAPDSSVAHNFPALIFLALEAGPNNTPSIALLRQLSAIYFERVKQRFDWSAGLFAPLSIIGIGFVIGFVVISLFMPLVSLVSSLSG